MLAGEGLLSCHCYQPNKINQDLAKPQWRAVLVRYFVDCKALVTTESKTLDSYSQLSQVFFHCFKL